MTRVEAARAWAKVLAYIACGKPERATPWARQLVAWWDTEGVFSVDVEAQFAAHRAADPHCTCNDCIAWTAGPEDR